MPATSSPPPPPTLRLFIALYPPLDVARLMLNLLTGAAGTSSARPTPARQVHMTLRFLGPVAAAEVDQLSSAIATAAANTPPFELRPLELIPIPPRGRPPHIIALRTDAPPPLSSLADRLAAIPLPSSCQRSPREHETFLPHFTLLRAGRNGSVRPIQRPVNTLSPFPVSRISLMQSVLDRSGAVHEEVRGFQLDERCSGNTK